MRPFLTFIVLAAAAAIVGCCPNCGRGAEPKPRLIDKGGCVCNQGCQCAQTKVCTCKGGCDCYPCPGRRNTDAGHWVADGTGDLAWFVGGDFRGWYLARTGLFHHYKAGVFVSTEKLTEPRPVYAIPPMLSGNCSGGCCSGQCRR